MTSTLRRRHDDDDDDDDGDRDRDPYRLLRRRRQPPSPSSARRSREHLRRVNRDLSTSLPTAAAFVLVPFVGYAFLFLGMAFPRLLLSRQFHTKGQRSDFGTTEYRRRRGWYETLSNGDFWGCCMRNVPGLVLSRREEEGEEEENGVGERIDDGDDDVPPFSGSLSYLEMDAAGPVLDERSMLTLYRLIRQNFGRDGPGDGAPSVIGKLQPSHLHHLALSNNLASSLLLPPALAPAFLQICLPCWYLVRRLTNLAEDVILDDAALIEEGMSRDGCAGMTDEEVFDACWIRGLPLGPFAATNGGVDSGGGSVDGEARATRRVLTNHLRMMEAVMSARCGPSMVVATDEDMSGSLRSRGELVRDPTLRLLILHLHPIRYSLMRNSVIKH
ncbi:hypothetical protein ACHAW5_007138 [Stephanodiscus triporus]|uniref:Letm1 RBD domain-containing protein n=1 Tax=Stephanodiscus triporus TaxID=2934178 RepID=A0ABD3R3K8_9STRA